MAPRACTELALVRRPTDSLMVMTVTEETVTVTRVTRDTISVTVPVH